MNHIHLLHVFILFYLHISSFVLLVHICMVSMSILAPFWHMMVCLQEYSGNILGVGSANERRRYIVTPSLISLATSRMIPGTIVSVGNTVLIILCVGSANEGKRYIVTPSLISWATPKMVSGIRHWLERHFSNCVFRSHRWLLKVSWLPVKI